MQVTIAPLTSAARGVALWLGSTLVLIAGLTAFGVMRPAFPNEAPVVAVGFLLGALVGGLAIWRKEPSRTALIWVIVNVAFAGLTLAFAVPLGLALSG